MCLGVPGKILEIYEVESLKMGKIQAVRRDHGLA